MLHRRLRAQHTHGRHLSAVHGVLHDLRHLPHIPHGVPLRQQGSLRNEVLREEQHLREYENGAVPPAQACAADLRGDSRMRVRGSDILRCERTMVLRVRPVLRS